MVNGQKIEDIQLPEAEGDVCPLSLFRRLILFKGFGSRGIWHQVRAKVTNLNIYSSQLAVIGIYEEENFWGNLREAGRRLPVLVKQLMEIDWGCHLDRH